MRAVIQRVSQARVSAGGEITGSIGKGLLVLVGIEERDTTEDITWLCAKIVNMRIFADEQGVMNMAINDAGGDILVVSQFTLHASTKKGNRPSYIRAARPEQAIPLYQQFIDHLEQLTGKHVFTGIFGAMMEVNLVNDGPVTILIDSRARE
jgi:D-tyrosyl-tRNA(Tyr) deacylase